MSKALFILEALNVHFLGLEQRVLFDDGGGAFLSHIP